MFEKIISWSPKLFTLFGIPVNFHISFIIFILILLITGNWSNLFVFMLVYPCVIIHEFGHIFAAKYYNCNCYKIIMLPFGGLAILDIPKEWNKQLWIAAWGPLVSLLLSLITLIFYLLTFELTSVSEFVLFISSINFFLFLFNCLPIFPMDGGRILKALLIPCIGQLQASNKITYISRSLIAILIIIGIITWNLPLIVIMIFLLFVEDEPNT